MAGVRVVERADRAQAGAATLDSLQDLVRYLRTIREERKAIITVSEGWLLYGPNRRLANRRGSEDRASWSRFPESIRSASASTAS